MEQELQNGWAQYIAAEIERRVTERLECMRLNETAYGDAQQSEPRDIWVLANESREAGDIDIPTELTEVCTRNSVEAIYSKQSIAKFLEKHPEPRGGHLKAPLVDNQIHAPFEVRKKDEPWFETQRAVLCAIRPLISMYGKIDTMAEEGPERDDILGDIRETIRYLKHVSGTIHVQRRTAVAGATGLLPGSESHHKMASSEGGQLFGPELRAAIEVEKKSAHPKGKPLSQLPEGRGRVIGGNIRWRPPKQQGSFQPRPFQQRRPQKLYQGQRPYQPSPNQE